MPWPTCSTTARAPYTGSPRPPACARPCWTRSINKTSQFTDLAVHWTMDFAQIKLADRFNRTGRALEAQGDFAGALQQFRKSLAIYEQLVAKDPANTAWQSALAASYHRIAGMLEVQGDLAGALHNLYFDLAIAQSLVAQDPANAGWQSDLASSFYRIGGVLEAQGDLTGALEEFRKSLAIIERLAAQNPADVDFQSDLTDRYYRVGAVLEARGDLSGALGEFRKSLAIFERLAAQDPTDACWQMDLANSFYLIGRVLEAQGDLTGALREYCEYLAIKERQASQNLHDIDLKRSLAYAFCKTGEVHEKLGEFSQAITLWRKELETRIEFVVLKDDHPEGIREIAACHNRIGGALEYSQENPGALVEFMAFLDLSTKILETGPDDAKFRRNVAVGQASVARAQMELGNFSSASAMNKLAEDTFRKLLDPGDPGTQIDLAAAIALGAEIDQRSGDSKAANQNSAELLTLELLTEGVVGCFRKRFLPLILARLSPRQ
jgi:tetratricopeptide (TPR) repeat protein